VNLYAGSRSQWSPSRCDDVAIGFDYGVLKFATNEDGTRQEIPLHHVFDRLASNPEQQLRDEDLTVDFQHDTRAFRVTFESLTFHRESDGIRVNTCELFLLER